MKSIKQDPEYMAVMKSGGTIKYCFTVIFRIYAEIQFISAIVRSWGLHMAPTFDDEAIPNAVKVGLKLADEWAKQRIKQLKP